MSRKKIKTYVAGGPALTATNLYIEPQTPFDIPEGAICHNCGMRPATIVWSDTGSMMDVVHGNYSYWCDLCAAKESLIYAQKQAVRVPDLIEELKKLEKKYFLGGKENENSLR